MENIKKKGGVTFVMALIQFGSIVTDMRNKLGGQVYSRNGSGSYVRNKVTPLNPNTSFQTLSRARLGANSSAWKGLTAPQQQGWRDASENFPRTNPVNGEYFMSGQQLYVAFNNNLVNIGQATIAVAPVGVAVPALTDLSVVMDLSSASVTLTFAATPAPAGFTWIVMATAGMSPGRNFVSSQLRQITTIAAAATSPAVISAAYITKFGAVPSAGLKVFFRVYAVSNTTGQAGVALDAQCIVQA